MSCLKVNIQYDHFYSSAQILILGKLSFQKLFFGCSVLRQDNVIHVISIMLRSGFRGGQFLTDLSRYAFIPLAVCFFRSLSCWNMKLLSIRHFPDCIPWCIQIWWYMQSLFHQYWQDLQKHSLEWSPKPQLCFTDDCRHSVLSLSFDDSLNQKFQKGIYPS